MKNVVAFLDSIVEEGLSLEALGSASDEEKASKGYDRRYRRLKQSAKEVFQYMGLDDYLAEFYKISHNAHYMFHDEIVNVTGLVESARDLIRHGCVGNLRHLLHAEMFNSLTEQAKGLLEAGHIVPSAVLGRIIIENWLRDQCEKAGLDIPEGAKASTMNEALKKAEVFSVPKWRQVQAYLDVGNAAAHGRPEEFSGQDVERVLSFIEVNCF